MKGRLKEGCFVVFSDINRSWMLALSESDCIAFYVELRASIEPLKGVIHISIRSRSPTSFL